MTIIAMMIDDCSLEMIYDSPFGSRAVSIGRPSDRNGSETQSESRDEQGIIPRVNKESVRNEGSHIPLTVGVLCPADFHFKSHIG